MYEYTDLLLTKMNTPESVRKVLVTLLDESIPEEMNRRLLKPLFPGTAQPQMLPRKRKERRKKALLAKFDPVTQKEAIFIESGLSKRGLGSGHATKGSRISLPQNPMGGREVSAWFADEYFLSHGAASTLCRP